MGSNPGKWEIRPSESLIISCFLRQNFKNKALDRLGGIEMKKMFDGAMIGFFCLLSCVLCTKICVAGTGSPLDAFPQAKDGQVRYVIYLDEKDRGEEEMFKVELIPGKIATTDGVNSSRVGLSLEPVILKGWGYTYYEVRGKDLLLSTMMAVPEGTTPVVGFVAGKPLMIRYNSRLPIVIYSPSGVDVRYRFWTAGEMEKAPKEE